MKSKLLKLSKRFITHELITGSFFIFLGTIVASLCNLILNLFLTRHFTAADYGIYAAVASMMALFTVPAQSISSAIIRFASSYLQKKDLSQAKKLFQQANIVLIGLSIVLVISFTIFSPWLTKFFQLSNFTYVILAAFTISLNYVMINSNGFLQSLLHFKYVSFLSASGSVLRLIFAIVLLFLGFRVQGVIAASVIATGIVLILSFIPLRFLFKSSSSSSTTIHVGEILQYGLFTGISLVALSSFITTDLILVKHFFSPSQAGEYAVLSLIGRIVFYITSPISTVLFPLLINRYEKGENINRLLFLACGLVLLPSLVLVIAYTIVPQLVIEIISGKSTYFVIAQYLPWYGMYITLYCIANILVLFLLAVRRSIVAYLAGSAALLQITLLIFFHANFFQVIAVSIFAIGFLCTMVMYLSFQARKIYEK